MNITFPEFQKNQNITFGHFKRANAKRVRAVSTSERRIVITTYRVPSILTPRHPVLDTRRPFFSPTTRLSLINHPCCGDSFMHSYMVQHDSTSAQAIGGAGASSVGATLDSTDNTGGPVSYTSEGVRHQWFRARSRRTCCVECWTRKGDWWRAGPWPGEFLCNSCGLSMKLTVFDVWGDGATSFVKPVM